MAIELHHFYPTNLANFTDRHEILVNNGRFNLSYDGKRYFNFPQSRDGHPRILTSDDYPSLVRYKFQFSRNFDLTKDSKILELLDRRISREDREFFSQ